MRNNPPKANNFILIIAVFIVIFVSGYGVFKLANKPQAKEFVPISGGNNNQVQAEKEDVTQQEQPKAETTTGTTTKTPTNTKVTYKTFSSKDLNISLKYPSTYTVQETQETVACEDVAEYVQNANPCPTGTDVSVPMISINTNIKDFRGLPYTLILHISKTSGIGGSCAESSTKTFSVTIKGKSEVLHTCISGTEVFADPSSITQISLSLKADYKSADIELSAKDNSMMNTYIEILRSITDLQ